MIFQSVCAEWRLVRQFCLKLVAMARPLSDLKKSFTSPNCIQIRTIWWKNCENRFSRSWDSSSPRIYFKTRIPSGHASILTQSKICAPRKCALLLPPKTSIMPNFIEIGQTNLVKSVTKLGPRTKIFFWSRTDRNADYLSRACCMWRLSLIHISEPTRPY